MRSLPGIKRAARDLRRSATPAERLLWSRLRARTLAGFKFRRQHSVGRFVLDFYCAEARLAIEVDGAQHLDSDRSHYDRVRSAQLALIHVRVLRFRNHEVLQGIDRVCHEIQATLCTLLPQGREKGRG